MDMISKQLDCLRYNPREPKVPIYWVLTRETSLCFVLALMTLKIF